MEERERIAMDLHDTVIQRLFATGMSLQATERMVEKPAVAERIQAAVDDLDATIGQVRSSIFALSSASRSDATSVRTRVLEVVGEMAEALRSEPRVQFVGPVDTTVPRELAAELPVILREMLSNVARHAHARRVDVLVGVDGAEVVVQVVDDGTGIAAGSAGAGQGLANLSSRAARSSGSFEVEARPDGGTSATWRVPLVR